MQEIQFVGPDGPFFECHSAEARIAVEAVKEYRKTGKALPDDVRSAVHNLPGLIDSLKDGGLERALIRPVKTMSMYKGSIYAMLSDLFSLIEKDTISPTHVLINPTTFAIRIRNLNKHEAAVAAVFELETRKACIDAGVVARIWTGTLFAVPSIPIDHFVVASRNGTPMHDRTFCGIYTPDNSRGEAVRTLGRLLDEVDKIKAFIHGL